MFRTRTNISDYLAASLLAAPISVLLHDIVFVQERTSSLVSFIFGCVFGMQNWMVGQECIFRFRLSHLAVPVIFIAVVIILGSMNRIRRENSMK